VTDGRLPPKLRRQLASPSRDTRLRALGELAQLAGSADIASASAARAELDRLTGDDSRSIAEAAAAALERSSISLDPAQLDFGRVPPGTPRLVAHVAVTGPPLARAAVVSACGPELRATLTGERLRVSWLPGSGSFAGTVLVSGPAGAATLTVTGEVTAGPLTGAAAEGRRRAANDVGGLRAHGRADGTPPAGTGRRRATVPLVGGAVLILLVAVGVAVGRRAYPGNVVAAPPSAAARTSRPPVQPLAVSVDEPEPARTIRVGREPEGVAVAPDSRTVYVANQGSRVLSVVDVTSHAVTAVHLRNTARFVTVSRDGRQIYVSMYEEDLSGSGVAVVDAATRRVIKYLDTGVQPYDLAVAPDGRLWVPIHGGRRVEIFTAGDEAPARRVDVPKNPHSVAFAADSKRAFTPDHESNSVSVIDMRTDRRITSLPVSESPHSLDVSPDGRTVVVAAFHANAVDFIDGVTLRRTGPFPVGRRPQSVAVSADGAHAYVVNEGDDSVSVLDTRNGAVTATVGVGGSPRTVAVAPDGRHAYVTNGDDDTITVLDVAG
jgi:YVTN family beta-propeller protein